MGRTKISCSCIDCKYCDDNYVCKKEKVNLIFLNVLTVNEGRQDYLKCKQFEERDDEEWLSIQNAAKEILGGFYNE